MSTPWSVFQDGRMGSPQADAESTQYTEARRMARASHHDRKERRLHGITTTRLWPPPQSASGPHPESIGDRSSPFRIRPRRIAAPIRSLPTISSTL
ncbi:hypothetical protein Syun_006791 [Stephania yunnanensis]|uniref:Uncharacterized protein n=1 Tax=Stephania yunnanensis TaxID=152371 RepID=A0AAP0PYU1_9MAGN